MRSAIDLLTQLVTGKSKRARIERAVTIYASMIGAIVLARAVDDAELSEKILRSVLASITHADTAA